MWRIIGTGRGKRQLCFRAFSFCSALILARLALAGNQPFGSSVLASGDQSYVVNRMVADFPTNEDFSTPEAAYATIHRVWAKEGDSAWRRLSIRPLAGRLPSAASQPLPAARTEQLLNTEVVEVHIFGETNAAVFGRMPHSRAGTIIDLRWFGREEGRWLNSGNDRASTLEDARKLVARRFAWQVAERKRASRPPVANPEEHLRTFVEFLRRKSANPQEFILKALAEHHVVILGEVHHRPRYWEFNSALVRSPEFARRVGVIHLELPANDQPLVDRFLAATNYDAQPIIETLRDMMEFGWPDLPMLDFFKTVWEVNQKLTLPQHLRIVLVDMARPWKEINTRSDWRTYEVNRDEFMAANIARDLREHAADTRHALFIVGYGHAMLNLHQPDGEPMKSAGWHLCEQLGSTNVFAVFPHSPVLRNVGGAQGRLALGLFESAFAALSIRAAAFPLDHGPFGEQVFDADPDRVTLDSYRHGYDAYLYLGPLEDEVFSPLIPGFFTDEFVREIDRRSRVMYGRGLVESGRATLDGASFERWLNRTWGQPRHDWQHLGPLNAWHYGSDWEKQSRDSERHEPVR